MQLYYDQYYHIFNRSINRERLFYFEWNYIHFLQKMNRLHGFLDLVGYCLMPTHFHLIIKMNTPDQDTVRRCVGDLLSGYAKALNREQGRTGSLFQQHTKAKLIASERHLISAVMYVHQNPLRAGLVRHLQDWEYSSYREYLGHHRLMQVRTDVILEMCGGVKGFIEASQVMVDEMLM